MSIEQCRKDITVILRAYDFDVGLEAMISLIAGGCTLVPTNIQGPLLHRVLKEIRRQHKELANVQRKENSEAKYSARDADREDQRARTGEREPSVGTPPPSRVVEGDQPHPSGND